jgi:type II secretory pathway predicted ATPase ExeA
MDLDPYGLRQPPFQMTPDARLFFPSTVHSRAYAHLLYGLSQREGFVVVTGEVGAGKTTLIERLCAEFSSKGHAIARVMTTQVEAAELLRLVAMALGAPAEGGKAELLQGIVAALRRGIAERGRRHILIVDEAQALPVASLEELRMLSNVTEGEHALLQVVLMGQPQLRRTLARPDLDQLRQRVLAAYHLAALTREETHLYVRHRMTSVGWSGHPAWEETALDLVHVHSGGIPRRINRLCARVLLAGALEHAAVLTAELVGSTAEELTQDLGVICAEASSPQSEENRATLRALGERGVLTAEVGMTTEELTQDSGVIRAEAAPPQTKENGAALRSLAERVDQLELQLRAMEAEINRLEEMARNAPEVQAQFANLDRDYNVIRRNYEELLARREAVNIAEAARTGGDRVTLEVVDPPTVPTGPVSPNRLLRAAGVLLAALGAGGVLLFLLVQLDTSFYTLRELRGLGLAVPGTFSHPSRSRLLAPLPDGVRANLSRTPDEVSADAGYSPDANLRTVNRWHIKGCIATGRQEHGTKSATAKKPSTPGSLICHDDHQA